MGLLAIVGACRKSEKLSDHSFESEKLTNGELITLKSGVVVEKRGNEYIWMGDIVLSETQLANLEESGSIFKDRPAYIGPEKAIHPMYNTPINTKTGQTKPRAVGVYPNGYNLWAMVRYVKADNLTFDREYIIDQAIAHWEANTNVRFYDATGLPTVDPVYGFQYPYIEFVNANENSSNVGRVSPGGRQELKLSQGQPVSAAIHEIGHAIGLFHEQSRNDRDNYVTVNTSNLTTLGLAQFQKETSNYYMIGGYDFNSVMGYPSTSTDTRIVVNPAVSMYTRNDGVNNGNIEQGITLSTSDRAWPNTFYLPYKARYDTYLELDDIVYKPDNTIMTQQERLTLQASLNNGNPNPPPAYTTTGNVNMTVAGYHIRTVTSIYNSGAVVFAPSETPLLVAGGPPIYTANGQYKLILQTDGNFVLYRTSDSTPLWGSVNTFLKGGTRLYFQKDGNLVLYTDAGVSVWSTNIISYAANTHPLAREDARLLFQDDGNFIMCLPDNSTSLMGHIGASGTQGGIVSPHKGTLK